ncbi:protein NEDD1-like [Impatiens glandulifera]|uniref:protein NEDD1-like n=1 Tax=Impatiens glandulifera TaxID=253017 RepID=UPI001FB074A3|nr:protein NEDD1-like [Impatiens glandulifera]XP_047315786.1 protein NEDD1-like [Impatiens glandulifera]
MNIGNGIVAAAGGDTVKLFDASGESGDPCILSYTPSPSFQVNSVKWNHTNLVVASAGDDKKITLWRKNGQSMGTIPLAGNDVGDNIEESVMTINYTNKASRYMCSGGSSQVVRIWDLQRKRCIKWLRGHTGTITGAMYNCKDEHLASISLSGDLILHNLASGSRVAELKDPHNQELRVLDYSRNSRHLLVTAGDDGSVHLWDTTGRSPKVSWLKQHSAPTGGVSFSPSNDKIIATVGLDKKLYTLDSGSKRPSSCIPYEAPFSSLAFRDDGLILAAGTSNGRVVFYDIRGKPQPFTVLHAYGNSEDVTSLCWQRAKPVMVDENSCSDETILLGGATEDSVLMPDPMPSATSSSFSTSAAALRNCGSSGPSVDSSMFNSFDSSTVEETPNKSSLWTSGNLARLHAPNGYNFKDDMGVFSPVVEVQPIKPSLAKLWDEQEGEKKDSLQIDNKFSSLFPSSSKRFSLSEGGSTDPHPIFDWKSTTSSKQDGDSFSSSKLSSTISAESSKKNDSSITPPEAWGGLRLSERYHLRQSVNLPSRFATLSSGPMTGSTHLGSHDPSLSTSYLSSSSLGLTNLRVKDISSNRDTSFDQSEDASSSSRDMTKNVPSLSNLDSLGTPLTLPRRFSSYAERISATPQFCDASASVSTASPKTKKSGTETRDELLNAWSSRTDTSSATGSATLSPMNGRVSQPQQKPSSQLTTDQGSSFTLQLFQRTLEETLASFQKSIHEDMRNIHIEILRQFHMQEMEMSGTMSSILENQVELMKEVQTLRNENQKLRQLL